MKLDNPVTISGIGCLCALGMNLPECMDSIFKGTRNPAPPVNFSSTHPIPYPVFEITQDLDPIMMKGKQGILRTSQLALVAAHEAIFDAGLSLDMLSKKRVGVCMGTTVGAAMNNEEFYKEYREGRHPDMIQIKRYLNSNPSTCISESFRLTGPCQTIVNACSSGSDAIGIGSSWIRSGLCDIVLAGGADELSRITYNGFISLMITDDQPCKPFDVNRKGLNLGEGASVLVLESEKEVQVRGKKPRAIIRGYGSACDAHHLTAPHPEGIGLKQALAEAMRISNIDAKDVAFVNAHGTGTQDNDKVESQVLNELLPSVPFFSNKGVTGHTLGAAGSIGAALTIACLEQGKIPANAGFKIKDPELPVSPVQSNLRINGGIAISESLAFGGNNAVLIVGKPTS